MGIERQNIQMRLAFPEGDWGEAPGGSREGTEMPVAVCAPESPAEETAQPAEPPCTDPYARWCDRESLRRPTYVDSPQAGAGQRQHTTKEVVMTTATMATGTRTTETVAAESELRAAARRRGLTMKELAAMMGVSVRRLPVADCERGHRQWTPKMREKIVAVLGEVPGQGTVYRQGCVVTGESSFIRERARSLGMTMKDLADRTGVSYSYMTQVARGRQSMGVKVQARVESALHGPAKVAPAKCANRQGVVVAGESSYIRERARELGMSLRDLADRVGVSYGYMSMVARGHSNMGMKVQARVASALEAPVKVAPAQPACIDREAVWDRMNAHRFSQNEVARRAGISSAHLSQIMNGKSTPSAGVLKGLHGVLFQPTKAERVMPAEVKVLGWRKGERSGMVVRGAGGPGRGSKDGGGTVRVGGRVPWGAKAEFAYRAGYDGMGRVSVTHVVERGYSAMLKQPEMASA